MRRGWPVLSAARLRRGGIFSSMVRLSKVDKKNKRVYLILQMRDFLLF
jgi:hypothetical protein